MVSRQLKAKKTFDCMSETINGPRGMTHSFACVVTAAVRSVSAAPGMPRWWCFCFCCWRSANCFWWMLLSSAYECRSILRSV